MLSPAPGNLGRDALGGRTAVLDRVLDWTSSDRIRVDVDGPATAANYREFTASSYDNAHSLAQSAYAVSGISYSVAQVGADLYVFAPRYDQAILLTGRTLANISEANIVGTATTPTPSSSGPRTRRARRPTS